MTLGIILSVVPMILWGLNDYLAGLAGKYLSAKLTNLVFSVIGSAVALLIGLFFGLPKVGVEIWALYAFIELLIMAGFVCMVKAFMSGPIGILGPIANSYAAVTLLVSVLFLGQSFTSGQSFAAGLILVGLFAVSYEGMEVETKISRKSLFFAFAATIFWGVAYALPQTVEVEIPWHSFIQLLSLPGVVYAVSWYLLTTKRNKIKTELRRALTYLPATLGGLAGAVGMISFFSAYNLLDSTLIPSLFASSAPLITILIARFRDNERLNMIKRLGAMAIIVGVIGVNLFS